MSKQQDEFTMNQEKSETVIKWTVECKMVKIDKIVDQINITICFIFIII